MLEGLKRLFSRPAAVAGNLQAVHDWADGRKLDFRPVADEGGFVIEGQMGALPWRAEWGPSQRPYVPGMELRLRADVAEAGSMQAMVLDKALQVQMEHSVFEQYVEGVQTRIDNQTPAEMRWLVLYSKLEGSALGALRERYAAVGASKPFMMAWLAGPMTTALLEAPTVAEEPMALVLARGRLTLRAALPSPTPRALEAWLQLFQVALREARRAAAEASDAESSLPAASQWPGGGPPESP